MRGPCSATHLSTAALGSSPLRRSRNSRRSCSKSRARPAVSSRSHWSRAWKWLAAFCAQSRPERLAELGVGAGQLDLVDAELLAEHGEPDAPLSSNRRTIRSDDARAARPSRRAAARRPLASARGSGRSRSSSAALSLARPGRSRSTISPGFMSGRGAAQQVGDVQLEAGRGLVEQSEPDLLGHVGRVERRPQSRPCRTGARRRRRRRRPGRRRRLPPRSARRAR